MSATGIVLNPRAYVGSAEPPATALDDMSRFRNNGTFTGDGSPDWVRLPSGLWCLNYTGDGSDDAIDCGTDSSLRLTSPLAVEAWLNWTSGECAVFSNIRFVDSTNRDGFWVRIEATGVVQMQTSQNGVGADSMVTIDQISAGVWIHILVDLQVGIYINGSLSLSDTVTVSTYDTPYTFLIGARDQNNDGNYEAEFLGRIALPRAYIFSPSAAYVGKRYTATKHWFGK